MRSPLNKMTAYVAGFAWRRVCVALVLLAGCGSGPPVQEMSDARQAIAVARDAGAETHAASDLRSAEQYLDSAQRNLHERAYEKAREDALKAKLKALDALAATERPDQRDEH